MKLKPVFLSCGYLLMALAGAMLIPGLLDAWDGGGDARVFFAAAGATAFLGALLILPTRDHPFDLSGREIFPAVVLGWTAAAAAGALPFMATDLNLSAPQAFFEAASGVTGTGLSAIADLDGQPRGLLLWRALLQWMGGFALMALLLAAPRLSASEEGAVQDLSNVLPRLGQTLASTFAIYAALTFCCGLLLSAARIDLFDSIVHALATLSAGGFSTSAQSFGQFKNPLAEAVLIPFMIAAALPFALYLRALKGDGAALRRDPRVRWFLYGVGSVAAILTAALMIQGLPPDEALRRALFRAAAAASTTGFTLNDGALFGPFGVALLAALAFMGGCAGSTAGGLKVFRVQALWAQIALRLRRIASPRGVFQIDCSGQPVNEGAQAGAAALAVAWAATLCLTVTGLCVAGVPLSLALTLSFSALTGAGPAMAEFGGATALPSAQAPVLGILSGAMILGRVEIFTALALLSPRFWRR